MSEHLTSKEFWRNYWNTKTGLIYPLKRQYVLHQEFERVLEEHTIASAVELGGFPGYYSVFLKKYFGIETHLVDYVIQQPIIDALLQANDMPKDAVTVVEADIFATAPHRNFDLVFSCGLIEHFADTEKIIALHERYLNENGVLLLTLPNFKGLNGWFQKQFDPENYAKHNIASMDLNLLANCLKSLGLTEVKAAYTGGFSLWLENEKTQSVFVKCLLKSCWLLGKIFSKVFRSESKWTSPYIVVSGKK